MGWLFAVALGMQERPLGAVVGVAGFVVPQRLLLTLGGVALLVFAVSKVVTRFRHPRSRVGMRVGPRALVLWSFLMATAHGAGLMLVPVLVELRGEGVPSAMAESGHSGHAAHAGHGSVAAIDPLTPTLVAVGLHSADACRRGGDRGGGLSEGGRRGTAPRLGQPGSDLGRCPGNHRRHYPRPRSLAPPDRLMRAGPGSRTHDRGEPVVAGSPSDQARNGHRQTRGRVVRDP